MGENPAFALLTKVRGKHAPNLIPPDQPWRAGVSGAALVPQTACPGWVRGGSRVFDRIDQSDPSERPGLPTGCVCRHHWKVARPVPAWRTAKDAQRLQNDIGGYLRIQLRSKENPAC